MSKRKIKGYWSFDPWELFNEFGVFRKEFTLIKSGKIMGKVIFG